VGICFVSPVWRAGRFSALQSIDGSIFDVNSVDDSQCMTGRSKERRKLNRGLNRKRQKPNRIVVSGREYQGRNIFKRVQVFNNGAIAFTRFIPKVSLVLVLEFTRRKIHPCLE